MDSLIWLFIFNLSMTKHLHVLNGISSVDGTVLFYLYQLVYRMFLTV